MELIYFKLFQESNILQAESSNSLSHQQENLSLQPSIEVSKNELVAPPPSSNMHKPILKFSKTLSARPDLQWRGKKAKRSHSSVHQCSSNRDYFYNKNLKRKKSPKAKNKIYKRKTDPENTQNLNSHVEVIRKITLKK